MELFIDYVVFAIKSVAVLSAVIMAIGCGFWFLRPQQHEIWRGGDPYACFGAGRYDAQREGKVCPEYGE